MTMLASWRRPAIVLIIALLEGCVIIPAIPASVSTPSFSAMSFFDGRTTGQGRLKIALRTPHRVTVKGIGHVDDRGELVLDQTVTEAERAPKHREWIIREVKPGVYVGTLSDAIGPVVGTATGNRLHLHFRMTGRLVADQWLTLRPAGREADNVMIVRKLGLVVAVLRETIRKAN